MGVLTELRERVVEFECAEYASDEYHAAAKGVWAKMTGAERDSLHQLLFAASPVWDGDHISKSGRDGCIGAGLATRCVYQGEEGYTAATYRGAAVYRSVHGDEAMREGQKAARERFRRLAEKKAAKPGSRRLRWPWSGVKSLESILRKEERNAR